jgi:Site-specific recombinases, DNA invertase Pin homologs
MSDVKIIKATAQIEEKSTLRVAAYCRVSTASEEQGNSLQLQIDHYNRLIASNPNWIPAGVYAEKISGLDYSRSEFNKMIRKCKVGKIDMIVTKSISRFGRRMLETLECFQDLISKNIDIYFESENVHLLDERSREVIISILMMAQNESVSKGKNIQWGIRKSMRSGKSGFQNIKCFGYDRDESGKLAINDVEAEIVRLIFNLYLSEESMYGITKYLAENKHNSPTGNDKWTTAQINHLLTNEKYAGNILLQKSYVKNTLNQKSSINKGDVDQYFIEDNHEAIIASDIFEKVQLEMERRSQIKQGETDGKSKSRYNSKGLTGMIVCEECGRNYSRTTWSRNGQKKIVWRCINRLDHGKRICKNSPTILEEDIKQRIVLEFQLNEYDEKIAREKIQQILIKSSGDMEVARH